MLNAVNNPSLTPQRQRAFSGHTALMHQLGLSEEKYQTDAKRRPYKKSGFIYYKTSSVGTMAFVGLEVCDCWVMGVFQWVVGTKYIDDV